MRNEVPVRAISRGLSVLLAINRDGPMTLMDIAKATSLPYPTIMRIVKTFLHEGVIEKETGRKFYRVTSLVQALSAGYEAEDELVSSASGHIDELCHDVGWPISLMTRVGAHMMVRYTTHRLTSLTFSNYYSGFTLPISGSATGKVHMAFCCEQEREAIVEGWQTIDNESSRTGLLLVSDNDLLNKIRSDGYATNVGIVHNSEPGKTSSIGIPLFDTCGRYVASLALTYFVGAMKPQAAVENYLAKMLSTATAISENLGRTDDQIS